MYKRRSKWLRRHLLDEEPPTLELYHLGKDPTEQQNVAKDHPEVVQRLGEQFDQAYRPSSLEKHRMPALEGGILNK